MHHFHLRGWRGSNVYWIVFFIFMVKCFFYVCFEVILFSTNSAWEQRFLSWKYKLVPNCSNPEEDHDLEKVMATFALQTLFSPSHTCCHFIFPHHHELQCSHAVKWDESLRRLRLSCYPITQNGVGRSMALECFKWPSEGIYHTVPWSVPVVFWQC